MKKKFDISKFEVLKSSNGVKGGFSLAISGGNAGLDVSVTTNNCYSGNCVKGCQIIVKG